LSRSDLPGLAAGHTLLPVQSPTRLYSRLRHKEEMKVVQTYNTQEYRMIKVFFLR
jgi:hypothetical protein